MKKIVTILGARPQFVKGAVLSRVIASHKEIEEIIVHTGQHYDTNMSAVFFEEMKIPEPKYNLNINGLGHGAMTGKMLEAIEKVLLEEKPDAVVVFGDTNSTIAGALAAKKLHIKVVHIEAGLRSFNMHMPEEINRILTDRISDLLSCPTQKAIENLEKEGFSNLSNAVALHGDIMKDAVAFYSVRAEEKSTVIKSQDLKPENFVLATIHRQENTDCKNKLTAIFKALDEIHRNQKVVLPVHPRTAKKLKEYQIATHIALISPVGYFDMLALLKNCSVVITDSGGLQKEAFFNKKCCVIAREETEWVELVEHGFATISGSDSQKLVKDYKKFLKVKKSFEIPLYGDHVGEKIYQSIKKLIQA